jgi:hypothetical protein
MVEARQKSYLLLMLAQLVLLALYVVLDVIFELLPSQLDAAGQGVQLLFLEARDLGQAPVGVKHGHGLAGWLYESSDRPGKPLRVVCPGWVPGFRLLYREETAPEQCQSYSWRR